MKACAGLDTDMWFPSGGYDASRNSKPSGKRPPKLNRNNLIAKKICFTCEERVECLAHNIFTTCGIFGGRCSKERIRLRAAATEEGVAVFVATFGGRTGPLPPTSQSYGYTLQVSEEELVGWLYDNEKGILDGQRQCTETSTRDCA